MYFMTEEMKAINDKDEDKQVLIQLKHYFNRGCPIHFSMISGEWRNAIIRSINEDKGSVTIKEFVLGNQEYLYEEINPNSIEEYNVISVEKNDKENYYSPNKIEEHHLHPKFMDNYNGHGEVIKITKKHHIIIHNIIPSIIWKYVRYEEKKKCIDEVINFSKKYLESSHNKRDDIDLEKCDNKNLKDYEFSCSRCGYIMDIEDSICPVCNKLREDLEDEDY